MEAVCSPPDLPGSEVSFSALLVKISEDEEQQQCDNPRDNDDSGQNTFHADVVRLPSRFSGGGLRLAKD